MRDGVYASRAVQTASYETRTTMTMVLKKPKEKRFGRKKQDEKKPGGKKGEPQHSDAVMLVFSASVLAAAILLFVVLIRQPTPKPKLNANEKLQLRAHGGKAAKGDAP